MVSNCKETTEVTRFGTRATFGNLASWTDLPPEEPAVSDDRSLIDAVLRGEPVAEQAFIARYRRYLYRIIAKHGIGRDEREDLCQDIFLHLWMDSKRRLRLWQARSGCRFASYLAVIAGNVICDRRRRCRLVESKAVSNADEFLVERGHASPVDAPLECLLRQSRAHALEEALEELNARDAILIRRRHLKGESYKEIAGSLGMTVSHVGVSLFRAERRLRRRLEQPGYRELFIEEGGDVTPRTRTPRDS